MTRDAELAATDFVELVLGNIGSETDSWGLTAFPSFAGQAVSLYAAPANKAALRARWERGLRALLEAAEPGTDHQLTFVRSYAGASHSEEAIADLEALLDGSLTFDGLTIDQDLRWTFLNNLARVGRADDARIEAELANDNTISGKEHAAAARAAMPTAEAKERAWEQAMVDGSVPNETAKQVVLSFMRDGQQDILAPYVDRYLADVPLAWDRLGAHRAAVSLEYIFPRVLTSDEALAKVDAWLANEAERVNPGEVRFVREGRSDMARALAAQKKDA